MITEERAEEMIKRQVRISASRFEDATLCVNGKEARVQAEESLVTNIMRIVQAIERDEGGAGS